MQRFSFFHIETNMSEDSDRTPLSIASWKKYILGSTSQGIWICDTNGILKKIIPFQKQKRSAIFVRSTVINNELFLFGPAGIFQITLEGDEISLVRPKRLIKLKDFIKGPISDLLQLNDSIYWVSTRNSVYALNNISGVSETIFTMPLNDRDSHDPVNDVDPRLFKDRKGRVLLTHNRGIRIYNISPETFIDVPFGTTNFNINDIWDDGKNIWIATTELGLLLCETNLNVLSNYTTENGLCDNTIFSLDEHNGNLWLTTKRGIATVNLITKQISNYFERHGLLSHEFKKNGKTSLNGVLYLSSSKGIIKVRLSKFVDNALLTSRIFVSKVFTNNMQLDRHGLASINNIKTLSVDYGERISMSFGSGISFWDQNDYALQYKMDDQPWINMEAATEIIIDKLRPGTHDLKVRFRENENAMGSPFILAIKIIPAYYQQWWFYLLAFLFTLMLIYLLYQNRINQLKKLFNIRSQISQDLHDEVGATLSGISMYSHLTKELITKERPVAEIEKSLNVIQQAARDMIYKLSDIVWVVNPKNDSLEKLIRKVEEFAREITAVRQMEIKVNVSQNISGIKFLMDARRNIYLFYKEAINNAVKYSGATLLELSVISDNKITEFMICDNGRGFDATKVKPGNGLDNMRKRASQIGARLIIQTKPNEGVKVLLRCRH
jgi:two-component sensor histidine kinase